MNKHTQGPWKSAPGPSHNPNQRRVDTIMGDRIALIDSNHFWDIGASKGSAEANAYLIAAAPELLEVLEYHYINAINRKETTDKDGNEYEDYKLMRLIIAKAKGINTDIILSIKIPLKS